MLFASEISQNTCILAQNYTPGLCKVARVAIGSIPIPQCAFVGLHTNRKCIRTARCEKFYWRWPHERGKRISAERHWEHWNRGNFYFPRFRCRLYRVYENRRSKKRPTLVDERERMSFMQPDFTRCKLPCISRFANVSKINFNKS